MSKKDRWFFAVSLVIGVLPFSMMALAMYFLPDEVPVIVDLVGKDIAHVSKNRNLVIGFFCLIPILAVALAANLKWKKIIDKNYYAVTIGSVIISLAFLCFVLYQVIVQSRRVNVIKNFDFVGVISVIISYVLALLGVFIYDILPNAVLGFRNAYTMRSDAVWGAVHRNCSLVCCLGFTLLGVGLSFIRGLPALLLLLGGMAAYIFYTLIVSRYYFKKIVLADN